MFSLFIDLPYSQLDQCILCCIIIFYICIDENAKLTNLNSTVVCVVLGIQLDYTMIVIRSYIYVRVAIIEYTIIDMSIE